ncbi:hypothetical protein Tco_0654939 [Tanacetum coccineum]|uniref:Uncharacterized protein n=1 Tax=Tanacetum coccineum TaxID=301880 RepID=A0ABQ4X589_9ASTR
MWRVLKKFTPGTSGNNSGKQRICDELNIAKVALMANLSHYGSDDLAEVHNHDNVNNNMINQVVQVMSSSEQSNVVNHSEIEITSDSNIIPYSVTKLIAENEHLKQTYKQLYDLIKPARIRSKEQCDDLINQVNLKSVEISDLNASLQEKVLVITAFKNNLRKLKGKSLVDNDVIKHPSDPEMLKIDVEPITPKLLNKQTVHSAYIKHTQEEATVLSITPRQGGNARPKQQWISSQHMVSI